MPGVDLWTTRGAVAVERDVIRVHGPDAVEFLQGQLTQDVAALTGGASAHTLLLQPTGKVVAWMRATRSSDDEVVLDMDAGGGEPVRAALMRFKLRTKVELDLATQAGTAVRGPGSDAAAPDDALPSSWPGVEGFDLLGGSTPVDAAVADKAALEVLRIEAGVPANGIELTEATIPAEAGQWLIDASVSFTKGCYTGQELVARIDSRGGNVPRPIRGLRSEDGPLPVGGAVVAGDKDVGSVTSSARSTALGHIALAPIARSVEVGTVVEVRPAGGAATVATVAGLPLR